MKAGRFIGYSLFYTIAVGFLVYSLNPSNHKLEVFNYELDLPVAVWVIIPSVVMMLMAVAHMLYYGFADLLRQWTLQKDYKSFIEQVKDVLLGKEDQRIMKTKWFQLSSEVLRSFNIWGNMSVENIDNVEIKEIGKILSRVKSGEVVELKKYKLNKNNPLVIQNEFNRLRENPKSAGEIYKTYSDIDKSLANKAFDVMINHAMYSEIKNYSSMYDNKVVVKIMERLVDSDDELFIENKEIEELLKENKLTKEEYLQIAKMLKNGNFSPDGLIALFEDLCQNNVEAMDAYLYVLYEYQMLDKIRELIEGTEPSEFEKFKILLFLRDNSKIIDSSLII